MHLTKNVHLTVRCAKQPEFMVICVSVQSDSPDQFSTSSTQHLLIWALVSRCEMITTEDAVDQ